MPKPSASFERFRPAAAGPVFPPSSAGVFPRPGAVPDRDALLDDDAAVEWSEEHLVFLHWRLLQEVSHLADPAAPLEEKLDTLRWVFTERDKDRRPFSFASCLQVVGCSPLSPIAYCGRIDAEEVRESIRHHLKAWFDATLERYPAWVRDAVLHHPEWIEARLARNPQWINEQIKRTSTLGDLFA